MDAKCIQCAAKYCGNKLLDRSDMTFFTFPENDKLAKIWANNSNVENYNDESLLCAEHFEDKYFDKKFGKKAVFKQTVEPIPTIFYFDKDRETPRRIDDSLLSNNNIQLDFGNIGSYTDHFIETTNSLTSINTCTLSNNKVKSDSNSQSLISNKISVDFIYCRLCAKFLLDSNLHPIFGESKYNELLEMCLPGKYLETDEISLKICSQCISKLEHCYSILKSFIEADKKLKNFVTLNIQTKVNNPLPFRIFQTDSQTKVTDPSTSRNFQTDIQTKIIDPSTSRNFQTDTETKITDFSTSTNFQTDIQKKKTDPSTSRKFQTDIQTKITDPSTSRNFQTDIETKINVPSTSSNFQTKMNDSTISHQSDTISGPSNEITVQEREQIQFQCIHCSAIFDHKEDMVVHAFHFHPTSRGSKIISNIIKSKDSNQIKPKKYLQTSKNTTKRFQCIICTDILLTKEAVIAHTQAKHKLLSHTKILTKIIDLDHTKYNSLKNLVVKYMCISCPIIYESKQEVIEHALLLHPQNKIVSKTILMKRNDSIKKSSKLPEKYTNEINQPNKLFTYLGSKFKNKTIAPPVTVHKINKTNSKTNIQNESLECTFKIKYECRDCFILFNSYKEVLDHSDLLHPTLKESGLVASVVKVKDSINDEQNSIDCLNNDENAICVNDGTIIEVDPNEKAERRKKEQKMVMETRYKCLTCSKLFKTKDTMLQHSLLLHLNDLSPGWNEINCKVVKVKKESYYRYNTRKDRYECLICGTLHVAKISLISHTRVFHPSISKDKFLCRFVTANTIRSKECLHCNMVIKNYNRYRQHMQKHTTFTCETCDKKFNKLSNLRDHIKTHEEKKILETYKCLECDEIFSNRILRYIHEQIHKIPKNVSCSKCNKPFPSEFELKKHDKNYHAICLCDVCGKTYEVKYIRHHLETHNTNTPFKCKLCSRSFKTCGTLSKHKRTHFPTKKKYTMCQICGKLFLHESIKLHMRIHTGERPEVCEICGAAFRRKDHLRNHKKTHMQGKIYQCPICHANLFSKQAYKIHMESVHEKFKPVSFSSQSEKSFTCDICQKVFRQKLQLEDHLRMHAGQRIYSCDTCNKSFGTRIVLLQHKRTHIEYDKLPFQCEICDRKFRRLENLRNHRRVHTGEKPFPCPICQRPFRVRGEMVKHMRIHRRKEEILKKKPSPVVVSESENSSESQNSSKDGFSVHDSNSFEEFVSSNMPSLD